MALHEFIGDDKVVRLAHGALADNLSEAETVARVTKVNASTIGETVKYVIPMPLPYRVYGWRNNRAEPIVFDKYSEAAFQVSTAKHIYSGTEIIQEDLADETRAARVVGAQTLAVARGVNQGVVDAITGADYSVTIGAGIEEGGLRRAIREAAYALDKLGAPQRGRYLLVSPSFELAMGDDPRLVTQNWSGDANTSQAFAENVIARVGGFLVVRSATVPDGEAYAYSGEGFVFGAATPPPLQTKHSAVLDENDLALRWSYDASLAFMQNQSVVDVWTGFQAVELPLLIQDTAANTSLVTEETYFRHGVKLVLGGESVWPAANSDLAKVGVTAPVTGTVTP